MDIVQLAERPEAWDHLVATAPAPTPFFTRTVLAAHLKHRVTAVPRVVTAWRGTDLVAALPYRSGMRFGWLGTAHSAWTSPFVTSSTPLVAGIGTADAVSLLLDGMAATARLWVLPQFTLDDPLGEAVAREIGRRRWPFRVLGRFERPILDRRESYDAYAAGLTGSRRKDLGRRLRRLGEVGRVEFRAVIEGEDLSDAVSRFLELEQAGWKGRRGTAFASDPHRAAFARDLFGGGSAPPSARADLLLLDDRPIAVSLSLVVGRTAFLLKTAFDEALGRFAPGLLLEVAIVRALHAERFADRLNSATGPESPLADLFPDREEVGDLVVACDQDADAASLDRILRHETARRALLARAKRLYRRLQASRNA